MDAEARAEKRKDNTVLHAMVLVASLAAMVAGMAWSLYYVFPNGRRIDFAGFVMLWLREIVIVGFAFVVLLVFVVGALMNGLRRLSPKQRYDV